MAVTRGLLRGQTSPPSCILTGFAGQAACLRGHRDRGLSATWSPWHRGTRETLTNPEGMVFLTARVLLPLSPGKQTRQVEGKLRRAEVSGRFPHRTAPSLESRYFRKLKSPGLGKCDILHPVPPFPLAARFLVSGFDTL